MADNINARMILEILGRPASNVTDALNIVVDKISKEKGVRIIEKSIHEPLPVKDAKDLFTSFAEITVECDSLSTFFGITFAYMPSNIEILEPSNFNLQSAELTLLSNRILGRLHNYDAIARRLLVDNSNLKKKLGLPLNTSQPQPAQSQPQPQNSEKQDKKQKSTKKKSKSKKK